MRGFDDSSHGSNFNAKSKMYKYRVVELIPKKVKGPHWWSRSRIEYEKSCYPQMLTSENPISVGDFLATTKTMKVVDIEHKFNWHKVGAEVDATPYATFIYAIKAERVI